MVRMGQRRRFVNVKDVDLKTPICSNVNMNLLNHNISQLLLRLNINLDECTNDRIECNSMQLLPHSIKINVWLLRICFTRGKDKMWYIVWPRVQGRYKAGMIVLQPPTPCLMSSGGAGCGGGTIGTKGFALFTVPANKNHTISRYIY